MPEPTRTGLEEPVVIFVVKHGFLVGVRPSDEGAHICGPLITSLDKAERQAAKAKAALQRYGVRRPA